MEGFIGIPGATVSLPDTIEGFRMVVDGELDHIPEQAFYMVGGVEDVHVKAKELEAA